MAPIQPRVIDQWQRRALSNEKSIHPSIYKLTLCLANVYMLGHFRFYLNGKTMSVRKTILSLIASDSQLVNARAAKATGLSRQAVSGHLSRMKRDKLIQSQGTGRIVAYTLVNTVDSMTLYPREGLSEDTVWRRQCAPLISDLSENVKNIWHHGITEMVNNAIDHSDAKTVSVHLVRNAVYTEVTVQDAGVGIFRKIQEALELFEKREAILELAKGKFTTDPKNHSGEGIFFSSRIFDEFLIHSEELTFMHSEGAMDILTEHATNIPGTLVCMHLENDSTRDRQKIFDDFAAPDEYTFAKTVVPVRLAQHEGETLVSRSQAKRLAMRFERFQNVVLDFQGVESIGQGFADELFRVFATAHPNTVLLPINAFGDVKKMIARVTEKPQG